MKKGLTLAAVSTVMISVSTMANPVDLKDKVNTVSYALGYQTGKVFFDHKVDLNFDAFMQGFKYGLKTTNPAISESNVRLALENFQKDMMQKQEQQQLQEASKNQQAGQAFLAANQKKPGVKTLADGMQYKILTQGTGQSPSLNDTVSVDYEGSLIDGTVFDSSYKRGTPAKFKLNAVIPGWQEALQKMKVGGTWMLYIPPELAYGSTGSPGTIPPNSTLVFKVNLIAIAAAQ